MKKKMACTRCGGFMMWEQEYCERLNEIMDFFKCANCGDVVDEQIIKRRILEATGDTPKPDRGKKVDPTIPAYSVSSLRLTLLQPPVNMCHYFIPPKKAKRC